MNAVYFVHHLGSVHLQKKLITMYSSFQFAFIIDQVQSKDSRRSIRDNDFLLLVPIVFVK